MPAGKLGENSWSGKVWEAAEKNTGRRVEVVWRSLREEKEGRAWHSTGARLWRWRG